MNFRMIADCNDMSMAWASQKTFSTPYHFHSLTHYYTQLHKKWIRQEKQYNFH